MKPSFAVAFVVAVAAASAALGYWFGFKAAWNMSLMTSAAPRGVVALGQIKSIDSGHMTDVESLLEGDVDSGLMWWHEVAQSPLRGMLNTLSGDDVYPHNEKYVRRLASYRKTHPSPLLDPSLDAQLEAKLKADDPAFAAQLRDAGAEQRRVIEEMVAEYAP